MFGHRVKMAFLSCAAGLLLLSCSAAQGQVSASATSNIVDAIRRGAYPEAVQLSQAELEKNPANYQIWTLKGLALSRSHQESQALAAFRQALKLSPNYLAALEGAAEIEYRTGDENAILHLQRVITQHPQDSTAHAMLGVLEYRRKNCSAAIENFQAAKDILTRQPAALTQYGACLASLERYDEALPLFEEVLVLQPEAEHARYNLALAQWMAKQEKQAIETLQPQLDRQPPDDKSLGLAASIYESENDTPHAVELLRKAILQSPRDIGNYLDFATLSYAHASYSAGIDMLDAGLTQLPNSAQLYMARGVLYGESGEYDKAVADFQKANALDPKVSATLTAEGIVQSQQHNIDAAIQSFRVQVQKNPQDAIAHYLLAEALSERGDAAGSSVLAEEIRIAKRAVELNPKLREARDLLSSLYLRSGQKELAIEQCRAILHDDPKNQQALYHLILALRNSGNKEEVAGLVKQLTESRNAAQEENEHKKRYTLVVEP